MRDRLALAFERFKNGSIQLGLAVQSVVVRVLLVLTYVFVVGLTRLSAAIFARKYLRLHHNTPEANSFWIEAQLYEHNPEHLKRQF